MQFDLTDDQRAVYDAAFRYAEAELHPMLAKMDDEDWYPDYLMAKLGADGYCGLTAPPELGGAGLDLMAAGLAVAAGGFAALAVYAAYQAVTMSTIVSG